MIFHPTHKTRFSDSSFYDEKCVLCGVTDMRDINERERAAAPCKVNHTSRMKTAEQMREECALVAEGLEQKWRESAKQQHLLADKAWIGGVENSRAAPPENLIAKACKAAYDKENKE